MRLLSFGIAFLLAASTGANTGPLRQCNKSTVEITAQDLTTSRSFTIDNDIRNNFGTTVVYIDFTFNTTTRVDMTCTTSLDGGSTEYEIQSCDTSTVGTCASVDGGNFESVTLAADKNWPWRLDTEGFNDISCTISVGAGVGSGTDLITVTSRQCVKG